MDAQADSNNLDRLLAEDISNFDLNPRVEVVETWEGGYKAEIDFNTQGSTEPQSIELANFIGRVEQTYGLDLESQSTSSSSKTAIITPEAGYFSPGYNIDNSTGTGVVIFNTKNVSETELTDFADADEIDISSFGNTESDGEYQSFPATGEFNYGEAVQKSILLFEANQSGELSPNNRIAWREDSTLEDGTLQGKDLSGGYFDAGDHVKFGQPLAASMSMLALGGIEYKSAYKQSGQYDSLLETIKHGTDYLLKAHEIADGKTSRLYVQVGEGGKANDHGYWGAPETVDQYTTRNAFYIDADNPGSDVAASTAASLALSSKLFAEVDPEYSSELLDNAKMLFEFAETYQGKYSDSVAEANPYYTSWSGFTDDLAFGAAALGKVTGDKSYTTKAENYLKQEGLFDWTWASDNQAYGAAVILSQISDDPSIKQMTTEWLDLWVERDGEIDDTTGKRKGLAHRANWASVPLVSSTAFLAELYSDTVEYTPEYNQFALNQVNYILGDNPANLSYMVGFGDNYPERVHHRGSAGSQGLNDDLTPNDNILYGAVVGGPSQANDFAHNDLRNDWISNEVGISYNAPATGALIQQYDNFGGDPLTDSELNSLPGLEIPDLL